MSAIALTDGTTVEVPENLTERFVGVLPSDFGTERLLVVNDPSIPALPAYALSPCCNASDKGTEYGVVCRACYQDFPEGSYIFNPEAIVRRAA